MSENECCHGERSRTANRELRTATELNRNLFTPAQLQPDAAAFHKRYAVSCEQYKKRLQLM